MSFLPSCKSSISNQAPPPETIRPGSLLSKELLYKNEPIPDECMKYLVPILCGAENSREIDLNIFVAPKKQIDDDDEQQDKYEWSYIGTLPSGDHLIYAYLWPAYAMGKFAQIAIVRREGTTLKATALIEGGDRHATMICKNSWKLSGNQLTYSQGMTTGLLYHTLLDQYPTLKKQAKTKNNNQLYWGEAAYCGYGTFEVTIAHNGEIQNKRLISFTPAGGRRFESDQEKKEYIDNWVKGVAKNSLAMGDALMQLTELYSYQGETDALDIQQLKKMTMEAFAYAKERT